VNFYRIVTKPLIKWHIYVKMNTSCIRKRLIFLHYNLRTGRLNCEANKLMFKKKLVVIKGNKTSKPRLWVKRPCTDKTDLKEKIKILFNKKSDVTTVKPVSSAVQIFNRIKYGTLYATAAAVMCFVVYGSFLSLDLTVANTAMVDGQAVGIVDSRDYFKALYTNVHNELKATLGDGYTTVGEEKKVSFMPCIAFEKNVSDEYSLRQGIMSLYDGVASAYAVYVDDKLVCAAFEKAEIDNALNEIKVAYGNADNSEFVEKIEIKNEYVTTTFIRFGDNIKKELTENKRIAAKYVVKENDTIWEIATNNNMSVQEIEQLNPDMPEILTTGTELNINTYVPGISVRTTNHVEGEFEIACATEVIYDKTLPKGQKQVVTAGQNGLQYVKKDVISLNGDEVSENVFEQKTIKEPVTEVIKIGTKPNGVGTGSFMRPTYGSLSSRYGTRWNRQHQGIDIAASQGTDIYAADAGIVEYSGWESGYGYLVKINHQNGYVTYYGHCSKLLVSKGAVVEKGDLIAKVGSTGRSTGPHLHFEVRLNGVPQNPLNYINTK